MADIFISYASEDRDRVMPIIKALEEQGWSTWWDSSSIWETNVLLEIWLTTWVPNGPSL
jgi:hypothetical protein